MTYAGTDGCKENTTIPISTKRPQNDVTFPRQILCTIPNIYTSFMKVTSDMKFVFLIIIWFNIAATSLSINFDSQQLYY